MKPTRSWLIPVFVLLCTTVIAQSPGLIVRPAGGAGTTALNPNGDGYSSATTAGFVTDDIAESEIPFRVVPPAISEPIGDLLTGPSGGFTDIVPQVDGIGFYMYKDATNIYFRLRIGGVVSGSKGYSVLIDTDGKMGTAQPNADPNYVAPSGTSPGNPGFEYEVVFRSNFEVSVYNIDGTATPGTPQSFTLNTHSQISVALTTDNNNADYFYDWYVPLSAIGNPSSIRVAATTVTSPNSALQGTRSDIYGVDDASYTNTSAAWQLVVNAQPPIDLSNFGAQPPVCTNAPAITGSIAAGTAVAVAGTWSRLDNTKPSTATVSLYKNGVLVSTASVVTGGIWTIIVPTVVNGDVFYAKALSAGETSCLQSNNITASACLVLPAAPALTCGSLKGISGTMPSTVLGNTIKVYQLPSTTASPTSDLVSTVSNLTYPTLTSFAYYTNGCSGGTNHVATGEYMIVTQNGSCVSNPVFVCINSGSSGVPPALTTNAIALSQTIYPYHTSISGTGATSGQILRLFINGTHAASISATGSAFTFTGLSLNAGDQLRIYAQTPGSCMTQSVQFTVSCFVQPPAISVNATGNLLTGAVNIAGTAGAPGALVQVYKGTAPSGTPVGAAVTVGATGSWLAVVPALLSGESYYAVLTSGGCTSAASSPAAVLTPAVCPVISGAYTDISTAISGTLPSAFTGTIRLYLDGNLVGSQSVTAALGWNITLPAGTLYYGAVLKATAQAAGTAESNGCTTVTTGCTSPQVPTASPLSTMVSVGHTVTFNVSNISAGSWYGVSDNSGKAYATSQYRITNSAFNMTTATFTSAGTYNLKVTADELNGCPASARSVSIVVNGALPLTLLSFSGNYANNQVNLFWTTTEEKDVSHFEIERSTDGTLFTSIGNVPVQNTTAAEHHYSYVVNAVLQAAVYFRLKIVDIDGKYEYSRVLMIKPTAQNNAAIKALPNPFARQLYLQYHASQASRINMRIMNASGILVYQRLLPVMPGENLLPVKESTTWASGHYFIRIQDERTAEGVQLKVTKQ